MFDFVIKFIHHYIESYTKPEDEKKFKNEFDEFMRDNHDAIEDRSIEKAIIEQERRNV